MTITVQHFLAHQGRNACADGKAFAEQYDTMQQVWDNCKRSDWMLWILNASKPMPDQMARKFACWCVRNTPTKHGTVWDLVTDPRSRNAVEVAERHADGLATDAELAAARDAAWDAARDAALDDARDAALAAALDDALDAAWDAARDAAWAAARDAARNAARDAQCREIRRLIPSIHEWLA